MAKTKKTPVSRRKNQKKSKLRSAPRFSKNMLLTLGVLFAGIGGFFVYRAYAYQNTVTYQASLRPSPVGPTEASYTVSTGKGNFTATLSNRTLDLSLEVKDSSGNIVGTLDNNGVRTVSFTKAVEAGTYTAKVYYKKQLVSRKPYTLKINYPEKGSQLPTAVITSPAGSSTVTGTVNFNVDATDDVGVSKVELYANNVLLVSDTSAPYTYALDTTKYPNDVVGLTAKAYDAEGQVANAAINITVNNPVTPPPTDPGGGGGGSSGGGTVTPPGQIPADQLPRAVVQAAWSQTRIFNYGDGDPTAGDGTGNFRIICSFTHMSYDDPIVYPGQPGKAHLHTFFGNAGSNYASTYASLTAPGQGSSCSGGAANLTSYWMPTLLDDGKPVVPSAIRVYYKSGYRGVSPQSVVDLPAGLKMVAGKASALTRQSQEIVAWGCVESGNYDEIIVPCASGRTLEATVTFPQCWNGKDLDSADHISHLRYPGSYPQAPGTVGFYGDGCSKETGFTTPIPVISVIVSYTIPTSNGTSKMKLSSDQAGALPGASLHADYMEGWSRAPQAILGGKTVTNTWLTNCIHRELSCTQGLGEGHYLRSDLW
jgi:hypothetical protein